MVPRSGVVIFPCFQRLSTTESIEASSLWCSRTGQRLASKVLASFENRARLEATRKAAKGRSTMCTQSVMSATVLAVAGWSIHALAGIAIARDSLLASQVISDPASGERTGLGLVTLDVTGIASMDRLRSPNNVVVFLWVGPYNVVNGGGFDVYLQTVAPGSRLSDISVAVTNSAFELPAFGFSPGALESVPGGPNHYMREVGDLPPNLPSVQVLADGLVRLEFFDGFDEAPGAPDGLWVSGTVTLQTAFPIPQPVSPGVVGVFGIAGLAAMKRHRARASGFE